MIKEETYVIEGAGLPGENSLPFFRDRVSDISVAMGGNVSEEDRKNLGIDNGRRVLPYTMQDHYDRKKKPMEFPSLVLENDFLKAIFLPSLGGRLVSLYDKKEDRELLHRNPVFQPANLAIRNAWFSGGIEWNLGHLGHSVVTCSPLFSALITGEDGEEGLRLYQFERMKRLWWQMDIFLPQESQFLQVTTHIRNAEDQGKNLYWWTNIAVEEEEGSRILAPGDKGLYIDYETKGFGHFKLPELSTINGKDATYPVNYHFANEFFFKLNRERRPFVASVNKDGKAFVEFSTAAMTARKLFVWGQHQGGQHWQDFLALKGERYVEIQAGLAPTQRHTLPMNGNSTVSFTELFGSLTLEPALVHKSGFNQAVQTVHEALETKLPYSDLETLHKTRLATVDKTPDRLLSTADGWGALEKERYKNNNAIDPAPGLVFPEETLDQGQFYWLNILKGIEQKEISNQELSTTWITGPAWQSLLEEGMVNKRFTQWHHLLQAGIMAREDLHFKKAETYWLQSMKVRGNYQAARNLAILYKEQDQREDSLNYYRQAWQLSGSSEPIDLLIEYLNTLLELKDHDTLNEICRGLNQEQCHYDRIRLILIRHALINKDVDKAEKLISHEFAVIREGEASLHEIWSEIQELRKKLGLGEERPIPEYLDYGMH